MPATHQHQNLTFTTSILPPPGPNLTLPTAGNPSPSTNPPIFNDAMVVRLKVFVDEQHCTPESEIDSDDARSWHWVIYATSDANAKDVQSPVPVAVIRLVPPPQPPHELLTHPELASSLPPYDTQHEPCVKITRVAVLPEYRGYGLGRKLVDVVLEWAREHALEIDEAYARAVQEEGVELVGEGKKWKGLTLIHAQVQVQKMYERLGFVTDEALGRWDEEGIEHIGMWLKLDIGSS